MQNLPPKTNKDPVYKKFGERFLSRLRKRSGPTGRIHEKRGENVRNRPALYERSLYVIRKRKQKLPENRGSDKAQRIGPHPNTTCSYRSAKTCPFPNRQTGISRRSRRRRGARHRNYKKTRYGSVLRSVPWKHQERQSAAQSIGPGEQHPAVGRLAADDADAASTQIFRNMPCHIHTVVRAFSRAHNGQMPPQQTI